MTSPVGIFTPKSLFDANTVLAATADDTPAALTLAEQRILGRITSGNIVGLTAAQVLTLLGIAALTTKGDLLGYSTVPARLGVGSNNEVLTVDSAQALGVKWAAGGKFAQVVRNQLGAAFVTTTTIPFDDTVPANTEGVEYTTLAISPINASSTLLIKVVLQVTTDANNHAIAMLHKDSGAIVAVGIANSQGGDAYHTLTFHYAAAAGATSEQTWKVRVGTSDGGALRINSRSSAARIFGGVCASSIEIMEVLP